MRPFLLVIACLASITATAGDGSYQPRGNPYYETEVRHGQRFGFRESNPFAPSVFRTRALSGGTLEDGLEDEITRLERLLYEGTPAPSGRFGEVTARFGPQWSPYFQSQIRGVPDRDGQVPDSDSPEAQDLLVEMTGKAMRRHQALIAEQLLALYELRVARRLADQGLTPEMIGTRPARNQDRATAGMAGDALPALAGSAVKVASFSNPVGHFLPRNGGPQVLDVRTFTPDSPQNTVLLVSIQAILQRLDDSPATASVSVELELPAEKTGLPETVAGPAIQFLKEDPRIVRRASSCPAAAEGVTPEGGPHDQPRYTLRLVTPDGATGGNVMVSHVVVKVYYVTGGFIEAGTIK